MSTPDNELLLLGLLAERERHGYELREFLSEQLRFVSDMPRATAYRLLDKLRTDGLIEGELEQKGPRPARRTFHLTSKGKREYARMLRTALARPDVPLAPGRVPLLFISALPADEASALVQRRIEALAATRDDREHALACHPEDAPGRLILEHDVAILDAELAFLLRIAARLRARMSKRSP